MTSIILAVVALGLLTLGYVFYSPKVSRWVSVDEEEPTPAVTVNDGVDYVPARHWTMLFGHHFASIAGAAPIIGPVYQVVFKEGGWIKAFGMGYGEITKTLLGGLGALIGITMLKTFVMTRLDSATRITRYLCSELFGDTFGIAPLKNKYAATVFVGLLAGALALGNWKAIWPVFGASNQLVASVVLIVTGVYLLKRKGGYLFVAIPAVLMLVTTVGALVYQAIGFFTAAKPKLLLGSISILLLVMAFFLVWEGVRTIGSLGKVALADAGTSG